VAAIIQQPQLIIIAITTMTAVTIMYAFLTTSYSAQFIVLMLLLRFLYPSEVEQFLTIVMHPLTNPPILFVYLIFPFLPFHSFP
jgi:hypothetical protein